MVKNSLMAHNIHPEDQEREFRVWDMTLKAVVLL